MESGEFRIGVDPSFPPFESDDGKGNLKGLDIALVDELLGDWSRANDVKIRADYIYTGFDGLYDALKAGQFDAIVSALPYDPKKTQDVLFSYSYFNGGPLLIVREGSTAKTYYELAGRGVGVELGSTGDSFARHWQRRLKYDLREFNSPAEALGALRSGQVDGVFADALAFNEFQRTQGGVMAVGEPLVNELTVVAVSKDAPTLWQNINAVIAAMKIDGRLARLEQEWLGAIQ